MSFGSITRIIFAVLILSVFGLQSCYYDVEEELYPADSTSCDTSAVSYATDIVPVLNSNCNNCHSSSSPSGGIILDTYNNVKIYADNGQLLGSIRWDSGYSQMPQGGNKLDNCTIKKFEAWINAGAPNN